MLKVFGKGKDEEELTTRQLELIEKISTKQAENSELSLSEIGAELGISRSYVSNLLALAEKHGLLENKEEEEIVTEEENPLERPSDLETPPPDGTEQMDAYIAIVQNWLLGRIAHIRGAIVGGRPLEMGEMDLEALNFCALCLDVVDREALVAEQQRQIAELEERKEKLGEEE